MGRVYPNRGGNGILIPSQNATQNNMLGVNIQRVTQGPLTCGDEAIDGVPHHSEELTFALDALEWIPAADSHQSGGGGGGGGVQQIEGSVACHLLQYHDRILLFDNYVKISQDSTIYYNVQCLV